jgi:DNA-binding response OmpR family regulator
MLSAQEGEDDQEESAVCGDNDYLSKPFILKEVLSQVKTLLKQDYRISNPTK